MRLFSNVLKILNLNNVRSLVEITFDMYKEFQKVNQIYNAIVYKNQLQSNTLHDIIYLTDSSFVGFFQKL